MGAPPHPFTSRLTAVDSSGNMRRGVDPKWRENLGFGEYLHEISGGCKKGLFEEGLNRRLWKWRALNALMSGSCSRERERFRRGFAGGERAGNLSNWVIIYQTEPGWRETGRCVNSELSAMFECQFPM